MRHAFPLIDPAGAVQAGQFAPVEVRHILRRVCLEPRLGVRRERQMYRPVDQCAGKERPCEKAKQDDGENR
jgi:hypothetical protein